MGYLSKTYDRYRYDIPRMEDSQDMSYMDILTHVENWINNKLKETHCKLYVNESKYRFTVGKFSTPFIPFNQDSLSIKEVLYYLVKHLSLYEPLDKDIQKVLKGLQ